MCPRENHGRNISEQIERTVVMPATLLGSNDIHGLSYLATGQVSL